MEEKKFANDFIIDRISFKYGSVQGYADAKGVSRQSVYDKIYRGSRKFIRELINDGVIEQKNEPDENLVKQVKILSELVLEQQGRLLKLEKEVENIKSVL